ALTDFDGLHRALQEMRSTVNRSRSARRGPPTGAPAAERAPLTESPRRNRPPRAERSGLRSSGGRSRDHAGIGLDDALLHQDALAQRLHDGRVVLQVLAGVLAALAGALVINGEPRA